jgi:hypothetical protein
MKPASAEAKNSAADAISSLAPSRPSGMAEVIWLYAMNLGARVLIRVGE